MSDFIKRFQKRNSLNPDGVIGFQTLSKIKEVCNIPTIEATAHFVGNTYHETGGYIRFVENLNYSAQQLANTWPTRFAVVPKATKKTPNSFALALQKRPIDIANSVYGGRMGNNTTGDGWKFRGRGALQTTGKTNYLLLAKFISVDLVKYPDLVADEYALQSAVFYFDSNKLWKTASSVNDDSITKIRKAVNGGSIGLEEVRKKVKEFYLMLLEGELKLVNNLLVVSIRAGKQNNTLVEQKRTLTAKIATIKK